MPTFVKVGRIVSAYSYGTQLLLATVLLCFLGQACAGLGLLAEDVVQEKALGEDSADRDCTDGDIVDLEDEIQGHKVMPHKLGQGFAESLFREGRLVLAKADHRWRAYASPHLAADAPPPRY